MKIVKKVFLPIILSLSGLLFSIGCSFDKTPDQNSSIDDKQDIRIDSLAAMCAEHDTEISSIKHSNEEQNSKIPEWQDNGLKKMIEEKGGFGWVEYTLLIVVVVVAAACLNLIYKIKPKFKRYEHDLLELKNRLALMEQSLQSNQKVQPTRQTSRGRTSLINRGMDDRANSNDYGTNATSVNVTQTGADMPPSHPQEPAPTIHMAYLDSPIISDNGDIYFQKLLPQEQKAAAVFSVEYDDSHGFFKPVDVIKIKDSDIVKRVIDFEKNGVSLKDAKTLDCVERGEVKIESDGALVVTKKAKVKLI